jgi:protease IV
MSRGRTLALALGVLFGLIAFVVVTVWILLSVMEDGALPGGNRVAVVELEGMILDGDAIVRQLREHEESPSVRAVVVRINSPGGVVAPTQEIVRGVERLRRAGKPVVASLGSVAASGGYYVATATDRIFASPGTLTGSIGVVMQMANVGGLLKRVGVDYVVIKAGRYKDLGNFSRTMTPEERQILQALLDDVYTQFVTAVAEGRKLDREAVLRLADGRVYSGRQALALRMVDELGGLEDAVEAAGRLSGIVGRPKVQYPRRRFSLMDLVRNELGLTSVAPLLPALPTLRTPLYLMD